jgi:hypothetical protein
MHTEIFKNHAFRSMRALVSSMIDRIEFRHHGIGVLQGYVQENTEPEIRVHIWHNSLLKPGIEISGDVHDHRFDMVSHVLHGAVVHEELNETPDPAGDHAMMALTHARAAADTAYHGPTTPLVGRFSVARERFVICAGNSYSFPAQKFHHSPLPYDLSDIAITVIEKHNQSELPARLLYPYGRDPVMAFGHRPDRTKIQSIVKYAKERLCQEVR